MNAFQRLYKRIFPRHECRALMIGLDASGRTTALYNMKLGEVVTTIPTIGFNVETFTVAGTDITAWDVGGCDKIRPLWRHYYANTQIVFFFVDSNDHERINDGSQDMTGYTAKWSLYLLTQEAELKDAVFVIVANKQDLPNALSVDQIVQRIDASTSLARYDWACFPVCAKRHDSVVPVFEWAAKAARAKKEGCPLPAVPADALSASASLPPVTTPAPATATATAPSDQKSDSAAAPQTDEWNFLAWIEAEDEDDDEFLRKFAEYSLDKWDHRIHLRIAWLLLTRHGRRDGLPRIFDGIRAFIKHSQRTNGRTFHETLTYFWVHMVHYAIVATKNPDQTFKTFLFMNPALADGQLWAYHYTKKRLMMDAEARNRVVLPDRKPLPSIIVSSSSSSSSSSSASSSTAAVDEKSPAEVVTSDIKTATESKAVKPAATKLQPQTDAEVFASWRENTLDAWGHSVMLRVIFTALSSLPRREAVDCLFEHMRTYQGTEFNFTLLYFWIQMVEVARARSKAAVATTYAEFQVANPELDNSQLWETHYSSELIWSPTAYQEFVMPDKKPFPSFVR